MSLDEQTRTGPSGYSLPLSPNGDSAMLTTPPWHFSGDVIMVEYQVDPDAATAFLPPELTAEPELGAAAVFASWQWCSADEAELADPGRCQFNEFLILLGCRYQDRPMARCPYAWVDDPVPMVRGWVQGMPKQFGAVYQTRPAQVGRAGPRMVEHGQFHGTLSVHGSRLAEAHVTLRGLADRTPVLHTVPLVHTRTFPAWTPGETPVSQLVTSRVTDVEFSDVWTGDADLRLFDHLTADFQRLAPVEIGAGYVFSYAETLHNGQLLA
jgi:enduracididine biosynthesis enzyme MppR